MWVPRGASRERRFRGTGVRGGRSGHTGLPRVSLLGFERMQEDAAAKG